MRPVHRAGAGHVVDDLFDGRLHAITDGADAIGRCREGHVARRDVLQIAAEVGESERLRIENLEELINAAESFGDAAVE